VELLNSLLIITTLNTPSKVTNNVKPYNLNFTIPSPSFFYTNKKLGVRFYSSNRQTKRENSTIRKLHGYYPNRFFFLSILFKEGVLIIFNHLTVEVVHYEIAYKELNKKLIIKEAINKLFISGIMLDFFSYSNNNKITNTIKSTNSNDTTFKPE
jgi:hypothetical protein